MSYKRGDLKIVRDCGHEGCDGSVCERDYCTPRFITDSSTSPYEYPTSIAYLEHRCDAWVIGGINEIDTLMDDLRHARAELRGASS